MTLTEQLADALLKSSRSLWHFTDYRNIASIQANGLLRTAELRRRGIIPITGGDEASLGIDTYKGFDEYVRLGFLRNHPMAHVAAQAGRIEQVRHLRVAPCVLGVTGVLVSDRVATANEAVIKPIEEMVSGLDFEVMYQRTDWRVPEIQARRGAAEKLEILVPLDIAVEHISGF
jgi:ssDNA thymidine ADP-ribosyltransferase, DarT